ncbi:hypothetical protein ABW636_18470 [Aquimarina sp. 2201CG1-2-11]|uniref:hypothetical protein n=1 Tax=Aquimarina discodermiae TaxID=3231043 RepID=UPI0034635E62
MQFLNIIIISLSLFLTVKNEKSKMTTVNTKSLIQPHSKSESISSNLNYQEMNIDVFKLKDREFKITKAYIKGVFKGGQLECYLEVETEERDIDNEIWQPNIIHQGLEFNISTWEELQGTSYNWKDADDPSYKHSEIGIIYVFNHCATTNNKLKFGKLKNGKIEVMWSGNVDVYWDNDFNTGVPFLLKTELTIHAK